MSLPARHRKRLAARLLLYGAVFGLVTLIVFFRFAERLEGGNHVVMRHAPPLDPAALELLRRDAHAAPGAVVFLGDSLTRALDVEAIAPGALNYGVDGYQTWHLLRVLPRLRAVRDARLVVLTIGTNDVKHHLQTGIGSRFRQISAAIPGPLLWNALPPNIDGDVGGINAAIRRECSRRPDCTYLETDFRADEFSDGVHPNERGYRRWIASLRAAMARTTNASSTGYGVASPFSAGHGRAR